MLLHRPLVFNNQNNLYNLSNLHIFASAYLHIKNLHIIFQRRR